MEKSNVEMGRSGRVMIEWSEEGLKWKKERRAVETLKGDYSDGRHPLHLQNIAEEEGNEEWSSVSFSHHRNEVLLCPSQENPLLTPRFFRVLEKSLGIQSWEMGNGERVLSTHLRRRNSIEIAPEVVKDFVELRGTKKIFHFTFNSTTLSTRSKQKKKHKEQTNWVNQRTIRIISGGKTEEGEKSGRSLTESQTETVTMRRFPERGFRRVKQCFRGRKGGLGRSYESIRMKRGYEHKEKEEDDIWKSHLEERREDGNTYCPLFRVSILVGSLRSAKILYSYFLIMNWSAAWDFTSALIDHDWIFSHFNVAFA